MFLYPVALLPVTNREDFLLTLQVWDDDAGVLVNLTGCTLAPNLQSFTGVLWTVTDGMIATTSTTSITITQSNPVSGNNPPATVPNPSFAATVGTGLGILVGDQVTFADVSGLNTFTGIVLTYNSVTGALTMQVGWTFEFEIRRWGGHGGFGDGYVEWYDIGTPDNFGPLLTAQLGTGINYLQGGYIQVLILAQIFQTTLEGYRLGGNKTYLVAMTAFDGYNTRQMFVGTLPIYYGGVNGSPASVVTPASWSNIF